MVVRKLTKRTNSVKENWHENHQKEVQVDVNVDSTCVRNQFEGKQNLIQIDFLPNRNKARFEDTHNRVTTYITKNNHEQLKRLREIKGIPISESINNALLEYFKKYQ